MSETAEVETPVREIEISVSVEVHSLSLCDSGLDNATMERQVEEHLKEVMQWEFGADDDRVHSVDVTAHATIKDVDA